MRLNAKIAILALAPALVLLAGCDEVLNGGWNYTEDFHSSYPLPANGQVEVENFNGGIEITGWNQSTVDISGTKFASTQERLKSVRVDVSAMPTSLVIRTAAEGDWPSRGGVRYVIRVPQKAQLRRISSSNGPVKLDTLDSGATVRTSNGPVHVNNVKGALDITTSNGPVVVEGANGGIDVRTSNGPIHLSLANPGEVRARTSNGPITVAVPRGTSGEIRART